LLPESVETIVASVNLNGNGPGVRFGYTSIALHDDELGPDLVVDLMPFVQNLLDVVLQIIKEIRQTLATRVKASPFLLFLKQFH
jgi:hypothetical protein